jgi:hypothetical protein
VAIETLGGYRLVRRLGGGDRADVFLAHPERADADAHPAAIKLTRPGVDDASVLREASALSRAAGDHVVELLDAAPGPHGVPALVLQRLPGGSVGRLLRERQRLAVGEAITILAPIVATVTRIHDAGVAHGGIRADAVLFDSTGAPVLACFGRATLVEPGLPPALREAEPAFGVDLLSLAAFCCQVLAATGSAGLLIEWIEYSVPLREDDWLAQLAARLFALGPAEPVALGAEPATPDRVAVVPTRLLSGSPVPPDEVVAPVVLPWIDALLPPPIAAAVRSHAARVRSSLAAVRRPVWIAAGAVVASLLVATMVVPQGDTDAAPPPVPPASTTPVPSMDAGLVGGDDPVAALAVLLETRERCIRELSVLCLDDVSQPGSSALATDQQLVRALQGGAESPMRFDAEGVQISLVERLGDSALLDLADAGESAPASVLLMKGEAGWRIRDYLE